MTGRVRVIGALLTALVLTLGFAPQVTAGNPNQTGDYVYQERTPKPLKNAKRSVLQGTRNADGSCHYEYPETSVAAAGGVIEVRDIGIDAKKCRKLIEQGEPSELPGEPGEGEERITDTIDDSASTESALTLAATSTASGYNWTWWEDVLGIKMTQVRTNISWSYNGSCAQTGSTSGEYYWAYGTGWSIVSYSGSEYETCSYYRGQSVATYKNTSFCWPLPTVYTYYYHVRAFGQENGSITATRSTDSKDECAPFWMHYQVRKVT